MTFVMGCNAWNHRFDCDCGWGGDTGGGGVRSAFSGFRAADGSIWSAHRRPAYTSFVNPNANCPVCWAPVYYYESPRGGRVFFDELGPPWPKHPCTDNPTSHIRDFKVSGVSPRSSNHVTEPLHSRHDWRPLLAEEVIQLGNFTRVRLPARERLPGKYIYIEDGWIGHAPCFWRWSPEDPGLIELSCLQIAPNGALETRTFAAPNWFRSDEDFWDWQARADDDYSAMTLNAIGWALSFSWSVPGIEKWWAVYPGVDLQLARTCFEQAAARGSWAAANNLGVMYRDGLGVPINHIKAFELFTEAAQELDVIPLRHLARCYREGLGCGPDPGFLQFLEETIVVLEAEGADK